MQLKISYFFGLTTLLLFSNCAGYRTAANYPEPRSLGKNYKTYVAPAEISNDYTSSLQIEAPKDTLTLKQALSLALLRNPELAAFSWEVRAREAGALQASLFRNPEIGVELSRIRKLRRFRKFRRISTNELRIDTLVAESYQGLSTAFHEATTLKTESFKTESTNY